MCCAHATSADRGDLFALATLACCDGGPRSRTPRPRWCWMRVRTRPLDLPATAGTLATTSAPTLPKPLATAAAAHGAPAACAPAAELPPGRNSSRRLIRRALLLSPSAGSRRSTPVTSTCTCGPTAAACATGGALHDGGHGAVEEVHPAHVPVLQGCVHDRRGLCRHRDQCVQQLCEQRSARAVRGNATAVIGWRYAMSLSAAAVAGTLIAHTLVEVDDRIEQDSGLSVGQAMRRIRGPLDELARDPPRTTARGMRWRRFRAKVLIDGPEPAAIRSPGRSSDCCCPCRSRSASAHRFPCGASA